MTHEELIQNIKKFRFWYHKIDLGHGVVTPGLNFDALWNMTRKSRQGIDYRGKKVLDLASFDGMWAFEAEKLGASLVVATDCYFETYKNFLFCRDALRSNVIPYYNISPYDLWNRLDVFFQENFDAQKPYDRLFDVVQHLGLLYHLRDPMLTLSQARSVLRTGGQLLIETAAVVDEDGSFMLFNGAPPTPERIYDDLTTWWAPTVPCLKEMLKATLFEPVEASVEILKDNDLKQVLKKGLKRLTGDRKFEISRVSMIATAVAAEGIDQEYYRELARTYRNPGLLVQHLGGPKA